MRNKQKGFSLIELLIVVAIILIIAAIAIPNLLRSKMAANEASAVASLRTINTAEVVYSSTYAVATVFSDTLVHLSDGGAPAQCVPGANPGADATHGCLIDPALAAANLAPGKSGYLIAYTQPGGNGTYQVLGDPVTAGSTGTRHFFTDQTDVIRQNATTTAAVTDSPI